METTIKRTMYKKETGKKAWTETAEMNDKTEIYRSLADDFIAKLNKANYVKSIRRRTLYNGYQEITVFYNITKNADYKAVYIVLN